MTFQRKETLETNLEDQRARIIAECGQEELEMFKELIERSVKYEINKSATTKIVTEAGTDGK